MVHLGPARVAAEGSHQPVQRASRDRHVHPVTNGAGTAVAVFPVLPPRGAGRDEVVVQARVVAAGDSQVPGVDDVVGHHLPRVLPCCRVAEGQVDGALQCTRLAERRDGGLPSGLSCVPGQAAKEVAVESLAHVVDGPPGDQRLDPAILADDVVDQGAHVPVHARGRAVPGAVRHGTHLMDEALDGAGVEVDDVESAGHPTPQRQGPAFSIVRRADFAVEVTRDPCA